MELKKVFSALVLGLVLTLFAAGPAAAETAVKAPATAADQAEAEAWYNLRAEHLEKIGPIRDQFWAKRMEYEALVRGGKADSPEIKAVIDDMVKLRAQIRTERKKLFSQAKEKGLTGRGHGRGWKSGGRGWRPDCPCGGGFHEGHRSGGLDRGDWGPGGGPGRGKRR